jgi:hypothetical protein
MMAFAKMFSNKTLLFVFHGYFSCSRSANVYRQVSSTAGMGEVANYLSGPSSFK